MGLFSSRRSAYGRTNPATSAPVEENVGGGNLVTGTVDNEAVVTGQAWADQFFPFASTDASIYDTGDLSGDLSPGPQNQPGVPAVDWYDSVVDLTVGPVSSYHAGVPVGQPYMSPIQYVENRPSGVVGWWNGKMAYDASPNGIAKGDAFSDVNGPNNGTYVPPIGQYVLPDRAQSLIVPPEWAYDNVNAHVDVPPALSPAWNS